MFEIYKSIKGRKTYLVFSGLEKPDEAIGEAKRFFKCSEYHLNISGCWILNDQLYLVDPEDKKAVKKCAIYYQ